MPNTIGIVVVAALAASAAFYVLPASNDPHRQPDQFGDQTRQAL